MTVLKRFLLDIIVYKPMQNKIIAVPWLNVIIVIYSSPRMLGDLEFQELNHAVKDSGQPRAYFHAYRDI